MSDEPKDKDTTEQLRESAHKIWLAGLGALATAEKEGTRLFRTLVERGEELEERGRSRFDEVRSKAGEATARVRETAGEAWSGVGKTLEAQVAKVLQTMGVPTRDELDALERRVRALEKKPAGARKRGAAKKKTAAKQP